MSKFRSCGDLCSSTSRAHRQLARLTESSGSAVATELRCASKYYLGTMDGRTWQWVRLAPADDRSNLARARSHCRSGGSTISIDLQFPLDRPCGLATSLGPQYFMTFAIAVKQLQSFLRRCRCRPLRRSCGDHFIWRILTAPRSCVY